MRFALLMFCFFSSAVTYAAPTPSYTINTSSTLSDFEIAYAQDKSKKLTVHQIARGDIASEIVDSQFVTPAVDANHWFSIELVNDSKQAVSRVIRLDDPHISQANIYYKNKRKWHTEFNGLTQPIGQRGLLSRFPSFMVTLQPSESKTIYLMVHSELYFRTVGIHIDPPDKFLLTEQLEIAGYSFFFGVVVGLIVYNLLLLLTLREKLYAYYVLHSSFYLAFVVIYSGFDLYLHSNDTFHYRPYSAAALAMALGFFSLFTRTLLKTRKLAPPADVTLVLLTTTFFISAMLIQWDIRFSYVLGMITIPATALLLLVGFITLMRKIPLSSVYVFGVSWFIIGVFLLSLVNIGLLDSNSFTRYSYLLGSMIELCALSFAIAYQFKSLEREKQGYQKRLTDNHMHVERKIRERTSELRRANIKLEHKSQVDGLTGLFNRRYFDSALHREWNRRNAQSLCVIICDIDHFKTYNDTFGHQHGDSCIRNVSDSIQQETNRATDICARYGGEEFVIILPNTTVWGGALLAERVRINVNNKNIPHRTATGRVTMSFGVCAAQPNPDMEPEELVKLADQALYQSKEQGRNRVTTASEDGELKPYVLVG